MAQKKLRSQSFNWNPEQVTITQLTEALDVINRKMLSITSSAFQFFVDQRYSGSRI